MRLARLWLKMAPPTNLDGCDVSEEILAESRSCGLRNQLVRSDPLLDPLPFPERSFDLVWAFSVFTHLSPEALQANFTKIRQLLTATGVFVFTVRPASYWNLSDPRAMLDAAGDRAERAGEATFVQHLPENPHYGDVSVTRGYLDGACHKAGLRIAGIEWNPSDPYQIIVIAAPA